MEHIVPSLYDWKSGGIIRIIQFDVSRGHLPSVVVVVVVVVRVTVGNLRSGRDVMVDVNVQVVLLVMGQTLGQ